MGHVNISLILVSHAAFYEFVKREKWAGTQSEGKLSILFDQFTQMKAVFYREPQNEP